MKRVTFITTGQPTTNPRLVKEAELLKNLGYSVTVICCFYHSWAEPFDKAITGKYPGMYIFCGGNPIFEKYVYFKTRLRQRICQKLFPYTKTAEIAANAISRAHTETVRIAKKIKTDLYIAHNLGALPAAVIAAKYRNAAVGYDAEDMHSAQYVSETDPMYLLNKYIEEKYFGQTNYFSAASPLIAQHYQQIYPFLKPVIINNVFPRTRLIIKQNYTKSQPLKLFWFSQTIGTDRGIELAIKAIAKSPVQLHLLGHCSPADQDTLLALGQQEGLAEQQLVFHAPIAPDDLFNFARNFDIGLASETGATLNRDICLTNKIFTYLQSGLAILASDTQAQALFLQQYPSSGKLYDKNDAGSLVKQLDKYLRDSRLLYETRLANYILGQTTLNWETEGAKFITLVESN